MLITAISKNISMKLNLKTETLIVAHRGASYILPENTIPSFQLAFKENADFIEGDFWLTKDNEIVCIHDRNTSRVTNNKNNLVVKKSTLFDLKKIDVGVWKGEQYKGISIPTLEEVLQIIPEGKGIYIEIKDYRENFTKKLAKILEQTSASEEKIRIICFNSEGIRLVKKYLSHIKTYWLFSWYPTKNKWLISAAQRKILRTLKTLHCDGIDLNPAPFVDADLVKSIRDNNLDFCAYNVNAIETAIMLLNLGVDSITTNSPLMMRKLITENFN